MLYILIEGFAKRFNYVKKKTHSKAPISRKCSQDKKGQVGLLIVKQFDL